jgi:hypothetical protein
MAKKAAAITESMEDDVALTEEEQAKLAAEESGEQPEQQPAPAPEAEAELPKLGQIPQAAKPAKKHEETVAYDRFEQLNERLKATEAQLAESNTYRERWARLEERQKLAKDAADAEAAAREAAKKAAEMPDPVLDPVGHRAWQAEQRAIKAEQRVEAIEKQWQETQVQGQQDRATFEMQNWLALQVPQARSVIPDYDTRVDYSRAARTAWWSRTFQFPDGTQVQLFPPDVARNITQNEELVLLNRAKQVGIPIGAVVTALSDTWGYQQWLAQQQQQQAGQNGNGQARAAAPPAGYQAVRQAAPPQVLPAASERLDQIQRGQAVQGMGRVASGETNAAMAWQQMSPQEFKAFVGNMPEDQYVQMIQDARFGKAFEKRVGEIDLTDLDAA